MSPDCRVLEVWDLVRYGSLDGLRGVAAAVVVVTHALVTFPAASDAFFGGEPNGWFLKVISDTPAHLIWAGPEAVYVFFVLSGLVLGLMARTADFDWRAYVPTRLLRLYLPVIAAVVLCAPILVFAPAPAADASGWLLARPASIGPREIFADVTLLTGASGAISPLWSLQWEVLFSLLLAAYVVVLVRRHAIWQFPALILLCAVGDAFQMWSLRYLPMFGIGVLMAGCWDELSQRFGRKTGLRASVGWLTVLLAAVVLLTVQWTFKGIGVSAPGWMTLPLQLLGVSTIVLGAAFAPGFSAILGSRPFRFLGTMSFSLYLVHEPILVYFARLIHDPALALLISIPTVALATVVFWRCIEQPAHRLSRYTRKRLSAPPADPAVSTAAPG